MAKDKIKIPIEFIPEGLSSIKKALGAFESAVKKFAANIRKISDQSTHSEQQWTFLYISFVNRRIAAAEREHKARMRMLNEYKEALKGVPTLGTSTTGGTTTSSSRSTTSSVRAAASAQITLSEDAAKKSAAAFERGERQKQDSIYRTKSEIARSVGDEVALEKLRGDRVMQLASRMYKDKQINEAEYRQSLNRGAAIIQNAEVAAYNKREAVAKASNARLVRQQAEANVSIARSLDDQVAVATSKHDLRVARYNEMLSKQRISESQFSGAVRASQEKLVRDITGIENKRVATAQAANQREIQGRLQLNEIVARSMGGQTGAARLIEIDRDKRIAAVNDLAAHYKWGSDEITKAHQQIRQGAERELGQLKRDTYDQLSTDLMQLGFRMQVTGAAMLAAFSAALAPAMDLEHNLAALKAVADPTAEQMKTLSEEALNLGKSSIYSSAEVARGMKDLGQAGFDATEIIQAMPSILSMAAAGEMNLAKATDTATGVVRGFNAGLAELPHMTDVLALTAVKTNAELSDLGESFKYVGPVAASAGASFEDVAASIGIIANAGIRGSMGGTALRQTFSALLAPTKVQSKMLKELGINLTDANGKFIGFIPTVAEFERVFKGIPSDAEKTAIVMRLVGDRAGPALAAMIKRGSGELRKLADELKYANGEAQKMANTRLDTLSGSLMKFRRSWDALLVTITENFLGFKTWVLVGKDVLDWITNMAKESAVLKGALGGIVGALGALGAVTLTVGSFALLFGVLGRIGTLVPEILPGLRSLVTVFGLLPRAMSAIAGTAGVSQFLLGMKGGLEGLSTSLLSTSSTASLLLRTLGAIASFVVPAIIVMIIYKQVWDKGKAAVTDAQGIFDEADQRIKEAEASIAKSQEKIVSFGGERSLSEMRKQANESYLIRQKYQDEIAALKDKEVKDDDERILALRRNIIAEENSLRNGYRAKSERAKSYSAEITKIYAQMAKLGASGENISSDMGFGNFLKYSAMMDFAGKSKEALKYEDWSKQVGELYTKLGMVKGIQTQIINEIKDQRLSGNKFITSPLETGVKSFAELGDEIVRIGEVSASVGDGIDALSARIDQSASESAAAIALIPDELRREQAEFDNEMALWKRRDDLIRNSDAAKFQMTAIDALIAKYEQMKRSAPSGEEGAKGLAEAQKIAVKATEDAYSARKKHLESYLQAMTKAEEDHAKKVADLQKDIAKAAIDADLERAKMKRPANLSDEQTAVLDLSEIKKLIEKRNALFASGNTELANQLTAQIVSMSSSLASGTASSIGTVMEKIPDEYKRAYLVAGNEAVRAYMSAWTEDKLAHGVPLPKNEHELSGALEAEANRLGNINDEAQRLADDALNWQAKYLKDSAEAEKNRLEAVRSTTEQIKTSIASLNTEMAAAFGRLGETGQVLTLKIGTNLILDDKTSQLLDLLKQEVPKEMKLKVTLDMAIDSKNTESIAKMLAQELANQLRFELTENRRWGGPITGKLSGYGGGDKVKAVLERGEYVVKKEAVSKYGSGFFDTLNAMRFAGGGLVRVFKAIPRMASAGATAAMHSIQLPTVPAVAFASGGAVGSSPAEAAVLGKYQLDLSFGGQTYSLFGRKEIVEAVVEELRREGATT